MEKEEEIGEIEEEEKEEQATERDELEEALAQVAEYRDGWQRTQAEFSNYRKRQEAERAQMMALASADILRKLLPVVDDFERAISSQVNSSQLTWREGILLIKDKLDAILESERVKPIKTAGQTFDPRYHEAVTYEEAPGYEDGQIIAEVQKGYTLNEWVLRPALVRVARMPAAQPEEEESCDTIEDEE